MGNPGYASLPLDKIFDEAVVPLDQLLAAGDADPFLSTILDEARESVGGVSLRRILEIAERYLDEGR
jgi:hypothetical protein